MDICVHYSAYVFFFYYFFFWGGGGLTCISNITIYLQIKTTHFNYVLLCFCICRFTKLITDGTSLENNLAPYVVSSVDFKTWIF